MRTKSLLSALAVATLGGCAFFHSLADGNKDGVSGDCDGSAHVCKIAIKVNHCAPHDRSSVTVTPDPRHVPNGRWVIQWDIATPGYMFAPDGITFKQGVPPGIFTGGTGSGNKFQFVDNNNAKGYYDYNVHILKENHAECLTVDPGISND